MLDRSASEILFVKRSKTILLTFERVELCCHFFGKVFELRRFDDVQTFLEFRLSVDGRCLDVTLDLECVRSQLKIKRKTEKNDPTKRIQ